VKSGIWLTINVFSFSAEEGGGASGGWLGVIGGGEGGQLCEENKAVAGYRAKPTAYWRINIAIAYLGGG